MSRTFQDASLLLWEAFPSGGRFGFDDDVKIVFHCLSDPQQRARFVATADNSAQAQKDVAHATLDELRAMLHRSTPLD